MAKLVDAPDLEEEMFFLINLFNRDLIGSHKFLLYLCVYKNIHNEERTGVWMPKRKLLE